MSAARRPTSAKARRTPRRPAGRERQRRPARTTYGARASRPYVAALLAAVLVGTLVIVSLSALGGGDGNGPATGPGGNASATGGGDGGPAGAAGPSPFAQDPGGDGGDGGPAEIVPLPEDDPVLALARREPDDPLAIGAQDAPLVMIEYADFQDAFAGVHARDVHDRLVSEYVAAGVLRIEFRNFPVNGPESDAAARAAWAAGQQDRFWEFYEAALGEEFHRDTGRFGEAGLRDLADEAGIPDVERFLRDTESAEAGAAVGRDAEGAYELGVTTIPSFLINGYPIAGAQNLDAFREIIEPLAAAERD